MPAHIFKHNYLLFLVTTAKLTIVTAGLFLTFWVSSATGRELNLPTTALPRRDSYEMANALNASFDYFHKLK